MSHSRTVAGLMNGVLLLALAGCGASSRGPARVEVQGHVTFEGKPIEQGDIAFYPSPGGSGAPTAGPITNGQYHLTGRAAILPGTYRVEIRAYDDPPGGSKDAAGIERPVGMVTLRQTLPAKFNSESRLEPLTVMEHDEMLTQNFSLTE